MEEAKSSELPAPTVKVLYQTMNDKIEYAVEYVMRKLIFWETDNKQIGRVIRFFHHFFVYVMVFMYISIHIFCRSYFLLVIFFSIFCIVFIHHMICGGCVWTRIEQRLIGDQRNFIDPLLELFHVPTTSDVSTPLFIMFTTMFMGIVSLEVIGQTIEHIKHWFSHFNSLL